MSEMDIDLFKRVIESSPVIVLVLLGAGVVLWRKLDQKDAMLMELQRETLTAMGNTTTAIRELKQAIESKR